VGIFWEQLEGLEWVEGHEWTMWAVIKISYVGTAVITAVLGTFLLFDVSKKYKNWTLDF